METERNRFSTEPIVTTVVYNMHYNDNYEPLKADIQNSRFIRGDHGLFTIHNDKFYLCSFQQQYDLNEFYRLLGFIEAKYNLPYFKTA